MLYNRHNTWEKISKDQIFTTFLTEYPELFRMRGLFIKNDKELFELFFELSSKGGSKFATEVNNKQQNEIIVEKFENSLDVLFYNVIKYDSIKNRSKNWNVNLHGFNSRNL